LIDFLNSNANNINTDKGKPSERLGRKATGLTNFKNSTIAGLPNKQNTVVFCSGALSSSVFRFFIKLIWGLDKMLNNHRNKNSSFNISQLSVAVSLAVFLVGCGGGSGDSSSSAGTAASFSGKAADGYLKGALVCLDINNNAACDSSEPFDITGEGGVYQFNDLDTSIDLSKVRLLVQVIANQTFDEDDLTGAPVSRSYTMSSPPGQTDFVSPITTLIDTQMQSNLGQTQAEAEVVVAQILGIKQDSTVDLTEDYVELKQNNASNDNGAADYQRLHHVAQAIATAIGVVQLDLQTQLDGFEGSQKKDAVNAIMSNVIAGLDDITSAIDLAIVNGNEVDIDNIVDSVKETIEIAQEGFEEAVDNVKDKREAQQANLREVLTQQGGLFVLEQDKEKIYLQSTNTCIVESELGYSHFNISDEVANFNFKIYNSQSQSFESEPQQQDDFSAYSLGKDGWSLISDDQQTEYSFSQDGDVITLTMPTSGVETFSAREIDLSGKRLANAARDQWVWREALSDSDARFSDNAKAYVIDAELTADHYILPIWQGCTADTGATIANCNAIRFGQQQSQIATEFSQLITTARPTEQNISTKAFNLYLQSEHQVMVALFQYPDGEFSENDDQKEEQDITQDTVAGTVSDSTDSDKLAVTGSKISGVNNNSKRIAKYFKYNRDCATDQLNCEALDFVGTSHWQTKVINGQEVLELDPPHWITQYDDKDDDVIRSPFLTVQDGQVRQGLILHSGKTEHNMIGLNAVALEQVIAGFNPQALRIELNPEHCGIEQPDDSDGSEQEQSQPPVIIADPSNTALLEGNRYLIKDNHETTLVNFESDSILHVIDTEHESNGQETEQQYGKWTVDANGKLLIAFENEWFTIKLIDGLGTSTINAIEDDGELRDIVLNLITPLPVTTQLTQPLLLTRDEHCSLSVELIGLEQSQGSAVIDATLCSNISEDMDAKIFEVRWVNENNAQLILEINSPADNFETTLIRLSQLTLAGESFILMDFGELTTDSSQETDHDLDFELWQLSQPTTTPETPTGSVGTT